MGSNLPSEKAIKLLDYRGEKELAKTLRRCWLELDVEDRGGTFQNDFVGDRSSPRPDEGVRVTPQLALSRTRDSLKDFQTLFTGGPSDSGRWLRVGNRRSDTDQLVTAIEEQKSLMISVRTGERRIQDANEEYKRRRAEIGKMLQSKDIKDPNSFFDLWSWYKRFKSGDLPTYASRSQLISSCMTRCSNACTKMAPPDTRHVR